MSETTRPGAAAKTAVPPSRRAWSVLAAAMRPVFIVGDVRSGTTILYRSILNHPSFRPSRGPNLSESKAVEQLARFFGPEDVVANGALANYLYDAAPLARVGRDIARLAGRRRIVRRLAGERIWQLPVWKAAGEHHVLRRYFLEADRERGAARLVEKTPHAVRWVPHLKTSFPQARFLYILRHPIDAYTSYRRRYENDPERTAWANISPEAFAASWAASTRRALGFARAERSFLMIRYEEFTRDTEGVLRRVMGHLGEAFDQECIPRDLPVPASSPLERPLYSAVVRETKRWQDYVDAAVTAELQRRLSETMALAGYEERTW